MAMTEPDVELELEIAEFVAEKAQPQRAAS